MLFSLKVEEIIIAVLTLKLTLPTSITSSAINYFTKSIRSSLQKHNSILKSSSCFVLWAMNDDHFKVLFYFCFEVNFLSNPKSPWLKKTRSKPKCTYTWCRTTNYFNTWLLLTSTAAFNFALITYIISSWLTANQSVSCFFSVNESSVSWK